MSTSSGAAATVTSMALWSRRGASQSADGPVDRTGEQDPCGRTDDVPREIAPGSIAVAGQIPGLLEHARAERDRDRGCDAGRPIVRGQRGAAVGDGRDRRARREVKRLVMAEPRI